MSISKILVPTDFSDCASHASEIAVLLARKTNAQLIFMNFFPDPEAGLHLRRREARNLNVVSPEVTAAKRKLDAVVRNAEHEGVPAKGVLVYDRGNDFIEDYAECYQADLIVMGTHGAKGLLEWVGGGSNTQRVSRNSSIPVLAIKNCAKQLEVRTILFASSFQEDVMPALSYITELARMWNATIHLLYVSPAIHSIEQKAAINRMNEVAARFPDCEFNCHISETNDEEIAISQTAHKLNADLITLTPHDRDGVVRFMSHSIAEKLVNHEELPVLVLPEN